MNIRTSQKSYKTYALNHAAFNPVDATTYYFGIAFTSNPPTIANIRKKTLKRSGYIKNITFDIITAGVLGSNHDSSMTLRINEVDVLVLTSTLKHTVAYQSLNFDVDIAVNDDDKIEIKWITPTWGTNPTSVAHTLTVEVEI